MSLKGGPELRARIKAVGQTFKPYGKLWRDTTARNMRRSIPVATGATRDSIRGKSATQKRATVVGSYITNFIDAGSKAHDIEARKKPLLIFEAGGRTIFTKKVHKARIAPRRFKRPAALDAIREHPMHETMIDLWNRAA